MKVEIKDYGLLIKSDEDWEITMDFMELGDSQVYNLFKDTTLRGILNQLIGNRVSIYEDQKKSILREDQILENLCSKILIQCIQKPHIQSVFLRPTDPKHLKQVNLGNIRWEDSYPLLLTLKQELIEVTGKHSLFDVHICFLEASQNFVNEMKSIDWEDRDIVDTVREKYQPLPDFASFQVGKLGNAIKKYIDVVNSFFELSSKKKKIDPKVPYYSLHHRNLVNTIFKKAQLDDKFRKTLLDPKSKEAKWSCFTSSLKQTRHWKNDRKINFFSRGAPGYLARTSFNIWIEDIPESVVDACYNAPKIIPAGEGGIAILHITREQPPVFQSDDIFVTINELRRAGLKIRKQDWENKSDC